MNRRPTLGRSALAATALLLFVTTAATGRINRAVGVVEYLEGDVRINGALELDRAGP